MSRKKAIFAFIGIKIDTFPALFPLFIWAGEWLQNFKQNFYKKVNYCDNIAKERFFRTFKYVCIYISDFKTIKEFKEGIKIIFNT